MIEAFPGDLCPKTGTWTPSNNAYFYPADYAEIMMRKHFKEGETMPATPHGEPSWILQEQGKPIENFTGLSAEEINSRIRKKAEGND